MLQLADDEEHWLRRAEEARALADMMTDPETRRAMLDIAEQYERLATRARERIAQSKKTNE